MKVVRVPWIQCRADEVTAELFESTWGGRDFDIMAYTEAEAREWWGGLSEAERRERLGMGGGSDEEPGLF